MQRSMLSTQKASTRALHRHIWHKERVASCRPMKLRITFKCFAQSWSQYFCHAAIHSGSLVVGTLKEIAQLDARSIHLLPARICERIEYVYACV